MTQDITKDQKEVMIQDTVVYTGANYVSQAIGMINSIVLRRFMGPMSMGVWSLLQVILEYCGYASFGTTKALARDYPFLRGKGDHKAAERLKDIVLSFTMLVSILPALAIGIYLYLHWKKLQRPLQIGFFFLLVFLFVQRFYDFVITLLRSDKKFQLLSQVTLLNAIGGLLVSLTLVWVWNIYGLYLGTTLILLLNLAFITAVNPYKFQFAWSPQILRQELKLGIPLVITAFLLSCLRSLDKLIIAKKLGFYELGLYSIVMMAQSYVLSAPMMFSHVWYPNLQEAYGQRGSAEGIRNYLLTPSLIISIVVPFLSALAIFLIPLLVSLLLPKFIGGIPAMQVYLLSPFFIILAQFSTSFLVTLDRYLVPFPILLVSIGLNLFLNISFVNAGWGLVGIASGTLISLSVNGVMIYLYALKYLGGWRKNWPDGLQPLLFSFIMLAMASVIDRGIISENMWATACLKVVVFFMVSAPFFWLLEQRTRLLQKVWSTFARVRKEHGMRP